MIQTPQNWHDYELIDAGNGEKLERWGKFTLRRPDPQAIWPRNEAVIDAWNSADLYFKKGVEGVGWEERGQVPSAWTIAYDELKLIVKHQGFKHTGVFPEQAVNWDFMTEQIKKFPTAQPKVLNLFGYTGAATVAATAAGAVVTHVDASKPAISWTKDNLVSSGLADKPVKLILEDAISFIKREIRRGNKYELITMDPPIFGRGDKGQVWKLEDDIEELVELTSQLLSDRPIGLIVNTYVSDLSVVSIANLVQSFLPKAQIEMSEIGLQMSSRDMVLPAGSCVRASF